jgi:large subunit ribosomal protein L17
MKKKVFGRKLGRSRPAREALFASLVRAMVLSGKIITTRAKAKAVQGDMERLVSLAKKGELSSQRKIMAYLDNSKDAFSALVYKVAPIFSTRTSGFTRLISLPSRKGDNARMVRIEWTEKIEEPKKAAKEKKVKKDVKNISAKSKRS